MTPRENLLATLGGGRPEWMPAGVHIANANNLPASLPAALLREPLDRLAVSRFIGGDIVHEVRAVRQQLPAGFALHGETRGETVITTLATPEGNLRGEVRRARTAPPDPGEIPPGHACPGPVTTSARTRHFISGPADYRVLAAYLRANRFEADAGLVAAEEARVGEEGLLVLGGGPPSPLYALAESYAGIERLSYDLCDAPAAVEAAMEAALESARRWYRAAAATPARAIRCTEDLDTKLVSPALFRRYAVPALAEYARICHARGKLFIVHMCGHVRDLLADVRDAGADALHCLALPPTGNTTPAEAARLLAGRSAAMVRADPALLLHGEGRAIDDWADRLKTESAGWPGVMVLIPCGRARLENIRRLIDRVRGAVHATPAPGRASRKEKR